MRNQVIAIIFVLAIGWAMYSVGYRTGYDKGHTEGEASMKAVMQTQLEAERAKVEAHRYRFERNGASLWRYDEIEGTACQLESNQTDNWVGGRCPPPAMTGLGTQ